MNGWTEDIRTVGWMGGRSVGRTNKSSEGRMDVWTNSDVQNIAIYSTDFLYELVDNNKFLEKKFERIWIWMYIWILGYELLFTAKT